MKPAAVFPELLKACPSFERVWEVCDDEDRALPCSRLGDFAHHLLEMKKEGREDVFIAAGAFIERMHLEGDANVRGLATIGLLEGIQKVWGNPGEEDQAFRPYLGDESVRWWDSLAKFWSKEIPFVGSDLDEANH